jgi:alpha-tubulin suppressor-like RCC1 family protein
MISTPTRAVRNLIVASFLLCLAFAIPTGSAAAFGQPMLSGGDAFQCALDDQSVERCWGSSYGDHLGAVTPGKNPAPVVMPGGAGAVAIANGGNTNCALKPDGTMYCWGENWSGELGRGTMSSGSPDAVQVLGTTTATQLGMGPGGTFCARLADGSAKCWGGGTHYQLGNGVAADNATPQYVVGLTGIKKITNGGATTCALLDSGAIKCWGQNSNGEVGNNAAGADVQTPTAVSGITNAIDIHVGYASACALLATGTVDCWGRNGYADLGNGDVSGTDKHVPTPIKDVSDAIQLTYGDSTGCVLLADHTVKCWGFADNGETGTGNDAQKVFTPTTVPGVTNVEQLPETVSNSVCVMQHGGAVVCWGDNSFGATGQPSPPNITGPATIAGLNLISARAATASAVTIPSKPKLDKKHKTFTLKGSVGATPDPIVLASTACSGTASVKAAYTVVTYKTVTKHGKKVKKKDTKKKSFKASAALALVAGKCSGAFTSKLKAKSFAKKKLKLTATFPGNGAMLAFTTPVKSYTMPKLPKVKKKK